MKKVLSLVFALVMSLGTAPVLAWGWGADGDCPYSKQKANQKQSEQVEESDK